jgi:hypothetical protein
MLATETKQERIAPRRNSREFPITPASAYPRFAAELWRWINQKEAEEDTYYQGLERHAAKIGISSDKMRRFTSGITKRPTRSDCVLIALYFNKDVESVLELAGWDTYRNITQKVSRELSDRHDLLETLRLTDSMLWSISQSKEKQNADEVLIGPERLLTKALLIADYVRSWYAQLSPEAKADLRNHLG